MIKTYYEQVTIKLSFSGELIIKREDKSSLFIQTKGNFIYSTISETTPAPTVRPPSRTAKRTPFSIAIGEINSTSK